MFFFVSLMFYICDDIEEYEDEKFFKSCCGDLRVSNAKCCGNSGGGV